MSYDHYGEFRRWTITDLIAVADFVLTHPSTVVLDAIYGCKPVGILSDRNAQAWFDGLMRISSPDSIEAFLASARIDDAAHSALVAHFGDLDSNIDKAAQFIEGAIPT